MSTTIPYDWVKQIDKSLLQNDEIPLFGTPPAFPWEQFSTALGQALKVEGLLIEPKEINLVQSENILSGLGSPAEVIAAAISPLQGEAFLAISKADVKQLLLSLLVKQEANLNVPESFLEGFLQFFLAEVLHVLGKVDYDKSLSFNLTKDQHLPETVCHTLDIRLSFQDKSFTARLIVPQSLRLAWKEHYAPRKLHTSISTTVAEKLPVIVHLEAGHVSLSPEEWKKISPCDFVMLDGCSLEDDGIKGRIKMVVNGKPMFRAKLKDGSIKILENSLLHEVQTPMAKHPEDEDEDEDDEDFSFDESEFSEVEEGEESEEETAEHSDVDLTVDEDLTEDEDLSEIEQEPKAAAKPAKEAVKEDKLAESPVKTLKGSKIVAAEEIPLNIVIEVGRLQMSVQKLMELQPGNMLELDVHPEDGVDLVVNGQTVAKGELLRLGETLGVRILDIG